MMCAQESLLLNVFIRANRTVQSTLIMLVFTLFFVSHSQSTLALELDDEAPNFKLPKLESSGELELNNYRGIVVYVDFWASWCGPCRLSLPVLSELREKYFAKGFEVMAINLDENIDEALDFLKQYPVSYPAIRDENSVTPNLYGVRGMPTGYLIDRQGNIHKVHEGFKKSDAKRLEQEIVTLLDKGM